MADPSAPHRTPETPRGWHQMTTRNRTPHRMNHHKASARLAQLQPSAPIVSNSSCANHPAPGTCYHKPTAFCLNDGSQPWKQRWSISNLEWEKPSPFLGPGCRCHESGLGELWFFPSNGLIKEELEKELRSTFRSRKTKALRSFHFSLFGRVQPPQEKSQPEEEAARTDVRHRWYRYLHPGMAAEDSSWLFKLCEQV